MSTTPKLLRNLRLKRVSLVDSPANPEARVVFFKRDESSKEEPVKKDDDGDADDVGKAACAKCGYGMSKGTKFCSNCGAQMSDTNKSAGDLLDKITDPEAKKAVEKMQADLQAAQSLLEKAAKEEKSETKTPEDVLKGLSAEARAVVEKAQKDADEAKAQAKLASDIVAKMQDEAETRSFVDIAKQFNRLSLKAEDFGPILKRVKKLDEKQYEELTRVLKAANAAAKPMFEVVGKRTDGSGSATAKERISAMAQELVAKGKDIDLPKAIAQVCSENPELYRAYGEEIKQQKPSLAVNGDEGEE